MIPYQIRSFRGGVSDENDKGIAGSFKFGYGLDIHKRSDSLTCGQKTETVLDLTRGMGDTYTGTTMTSLFNFFVPASDGSLYAFGDTGSIFCRSGEGSWLYVYNDENGRINGAAEWELSDGSNYLFWATASALARKPLPGSNSAPDSGSMLWTDATQDYKVEFIDSTCAWHTMKPAAGALYMANGESLAELDFNGNWNPAKTNVRPHNILTCLEERDDYVIMGSERRDGMEEGHIWSWVVTATNYVQKKKIPVQGINALIYTELPLLQGGDAGELFFSDFNTVVPLQAIPGGGKVNPGGVDILDDRAVFGVYGGTYPGIWSYGRKLKNRPFALNYDYRITNGTGTAISTIGAIGVIDGTLLISWGCTETDSSSYGIDQVQSTLKAYAAYEGLEFDGGVAHMRKKFDTIKITMTPMPVNTLLYAKYKLNNETNWRYAVLADRTTVFSQTDATVAIFNINRPAESYEVGIEMRPSGNTTPEVLSITTYISEERTEF